MTQGVRSSQTPVLREPASLVHNPAEFPFGSCDDRNSEMTREPQHVAGGGSSRDGLAAVAIIILTVVLIVFVVYQLV